MYFFPSFLFSFPFITSIYNNTIFCISSTSSILSFLSPSFFYYFHLQQHSLLLHVSSTSSSFTSSFLFLSPSFFLLLLPSLITFSSASRHLPLLHPFLSFIISIFNNILFCSMSPLRHPPLLHPFLSPSFSSITSIFNNIPFYFMSPLLHLFILLFH